jgi:hypothetical protein
VTPYNDATDAIRYQRFRGPYCMHLRCTVSRPEEGDLNHHHLNGTCVTLTLNHTPQSLDTSSESHVIILYPHTSVSKTMYHTGRQNHTRTVPSTAQTAPHISPLGMLLLRNNTTNHPQVIRYYSGWIPETLGRQKAVPSHLTTYQITSS